MYKNYEKDREHLVNTAAQYLTNVWLSILKATCTDQATRQQTVAMLFATLETENCLVKIESSEKALVKVLTDVKLSSRACNSTINVK